jgi:hypothetical protein
MYTKKYFVFKPAPVSVIVVTISDIIPNTFINEANVLLNYYNNNDTTSFNNEINTTYSELLTTDPTYTTNPTSNTAVQLINSLDVLFTKIQNTISDTIGDSFTDEANVLLNYYNRNNVTLFNNEMNTTYKNLLINNPTYADNITANITTQLINCLNKYFTLSQTSIVNDSMAIAFINEANVLLHYYHNNDIVSYNNEINTAYANLKSTLPNYINDITSNIAAQLIDVFNVLLTTNIDLQDQVIMLEEDLFAKIGTNIIGLDKLTIQQNTGFKLLYLQYLLMYDLKLTNGMFIDTYLHNAQNVLDLNNGILKHF